MDSSSPLHVVERGVGPELVLVHGSAADSSTFSVQLAALAGHLRMFAVDRRGCPRSPFAVDHSGTYTVERHADDIVALIRQRTAGSAYICGSSFGGVVALDVARRFPALVRGLVLCEPPLPSFDYAVAAPLGFGCYFDRLVARRGGRAAAEFFLRTVLGDVVYEHMPERIRQRSTGLWQQIRADSMALSAYSINYACLAAVDVPVLLLAGARSQPFYQPTLLALKRALPNATLRTVAGGSHMMHVDAAKQFNREVLGFLSPSLQTT